MPSNQELDFIAEVRKRECLYNFNDSSYLNKEVVAKCWEEVGNATGLSAQDAREKWRNIRSAFVRSLKLQAEHPSKMKKPYYLIDYLQFVLPYVKPASVSMRKQAVEADSFLTGQVFDPIAAPRVKCEFVHDDVITGDYEYVPQAKSPSPDNSPAGSPHNQEPEEFPQPVAQRRQLSSTRKRALPQKSEESVENSAAQITNKPSTTFPACVQQERGFAHEIPTISSMQHFLMSLLPELDSMTEQQKRHFKIRTLILIDEMKNSQTGKTYTGTYDSSTQK